MEEKKPLNFNTRDLARMFEEKTGKKLTWFPSGDPAFAAFYVTETGGFQGTGLMTKEIEMELMKLVIREAGRQWLEGNLKPDDEEKEE